MPNPSVSQSGVSHRRCREVGEHVCQKPSGRVCIEPGCDQKAGTLWGPLWCPEHDQERLDRVSRQMQEIARSFGA